jgi:hypothetical protein
MHMLGGFMKADRMVSSYRMRVITGCTLAMIISFSGYGQTSTQPVPTPSSQIDLSQLSYQALAGQKDAAKQDVSDINTQVSWLQSLIGVVDQLKQMQNDKTAKPEEVDVLRKQVKEYEGYAQVAAGTAMSADLRTLLRQKQSDLAAKKKLVDDLETELSRRVDIERPKQTFKAQMSLVFAFIVALVIIGFFVVAFKDEKVRQEIFAGQAGIQFITLFSLVIAIILFGITGVLEGKELSALLGGLAGYILGRSATTTKS